MSTAVSGVFFCIPRTWCHLVSCLCPCLSHWFFSKPLYWNLCFENIYCKFKVSNRKKSYWGRGCLYPSALTQPPSFPAMCGKDSLQVIELPGKVTAFYCERVCVCVLKCTVCAGKMRESGHITIKGSGCPSRLHYPWNDDFLAWLSGMDANFSPPWKEGINWIQLALLFPVKALGREDGGFLFCLSRETHTFLWHSLL